jgi:hypothetical protein
MVRAGGHLGRQPHFDLFVDLAVERGDLAPVRKTVLDTYSGNGNLRQLVRQMSLKCRKVPSH